MPRFAPTCQHPPHPFRALMLNGLQSRNDRFGVATAKNRPQKYRIYPDFDKMSANRLFCFLFSCHSQVFPCKMLLFRAFLCQNVNRFLAVLRCVPGFPATWRLSSFLKKKCVFSVKSLLLFCSLKNICYICIELIK